MRYFLSFFFLISVLTGCSSSGSDQRRWVEEGKVKVLCTTAMIQDIVAKVGGERVDALALITGEIDPHSYELVKGDDEKFSLADLIFYNGLGLEHGASLQYQLRYHPNAVALGDAIKEQSPEQIIYVDSEVDPHVWMDIQLFSQAVTPIVEALSKKDPEGKSFYRERGVVVEREMKGAHLAVYNQLQQIAEKRRYIVTSHDAFNYFTRAYLAETDEVQRGSWKKRFEAPEGLAPEGQLSTVDIQEVMNHLMDNQIHVVFSESNVSQDSLKKVIHACSKKRFVVDLCPRALYGDSMGPVGSGAENYLGMIAYDASVLIHAWNQGEKE